MATMMEEAVMVTGEIVPAMSTLAEAEAVIERGIAAYWDTGRALMAIRDNPDWLKDRAEYPDFDTYCKVRWDFGKRHYYRLIDSAEVVSVVEGVTKWSLPENEGQTRELSRLLKQPEKMVEAWAEANEEAVSQGKDVTAAMVRKAAQKRIPAPPKPKMGRGRKVSQGELYTQFIGIWLKADMDTRRKIRMFAEGPGY